MDLNFLISRCSHLEPVDEAFNAAWVAHRGADESVNPAFLPSIVVFALFLGSRDGSYDEEFLSGEAIRGIRSDFLDALGEYRPDGIRIPDDDTFKELCRNIWERMNEVLRKVNAGTPTERSDWKGWALEVADELRRVWPAADEFPLCTEAIPTIIKEGGGPWKSFAMLARGVQSFLDAQDGAVGVTSIEETASQTDDEIV
jgi:hypothetical protein